MTKTLVILESPNKCGKFREILGKDYIISASCGHIRNLDPKSLGIDIDNNFEPNYVVESDKRQVIQKLKKARSCWMGSLRRRAFKQLKYKTRWARTKRNADEEIEQKRRLDRSREGARAEEEDYFEELMLPSEKAARRREATMMAPTMMPISVFDENVSRN